ncbi:hypothetical protein PVK06_034435 [Gossypium arboreum]|uniref:Uncharacterized protein n=1 Tax=Gossypium arboreum TaxID=29729 RepID=A0ABR0NH32_GOSAR|nr:hypothetical protein PVK06_034435 [Gossypium arboreum]
MPNDRPNKNSSLMKPDFALEHRAGYDDIQHRPLLVCKRINFSTPDMLNIRDIVIGYFDAIGYWFARNFHAVLQCNRPLKLGSSITNLASRLLPSGIDFSSLTCAYSMDNLDKYCLDSMGLLVGTPTSCYFVPPGTQTTRRNMVFCQRLHINAREQEEQPLPVEARLSQIEA